jgi:hypothetical protein
MSPPTVCRNNILPVSNTKPGLMPGFFISIPQPFFSCNTKQTTNTGNQVLKACDIPSAYLGTWNKGAKGEISKNGGRRKGRRNKKGTAYRAHTAPKEGAFHGRAKDHPTILDTTEAVVLQRKILSTKFNNSRWSLVSCRGLMQIDPSTSGLRPCARDDKKGGFKNRPTTLPERIISIVRRRSPSWPDGRGRPGRSRRGGSGSRGSRRVPRHRRSGGAFGRGR